MAVYIVLGIMGGATIVLGRMVNADLAARIGVYKGTRMNYITGLAVSLLLLLVFWALGTPMPTLRGPQSAGQFLMYLGGATGLLTVLISNLIALRMSALVMTLLIFLGQLGAGILLDYFKTRTLPLGQLVGGILLLAGLFLYQKPGKTPPAKKPEGQGT